MTKKILIVSRSLPIPHVNGTAAHNADFIRYLEAEKCEIQFLHLSRAGSATYVGERVEPATAGAQGDAESWPTAYDSLATRTEAEIFARAFAAFDPDAVVVDYDWLADLFDAMPRGHRAKKIIFLHDLRTRILPATAQMGLQHQEQWDEAKEGALLRKADAILVLQAEDEAACRRMAPEATMIRIGISVAPVACDPADEVPGRVIYVGARSAENLIPLAEFLTESWPSVRAVLPEATLAVCGGIGELLRAPPEGVLAPPDGVIVVGPVADLQPHYAAAQVAIIPHKMKGGMKMKFVEALAHGRATVANVCGIDGLPEANYTSTFATDDPGAFAANIFILLQEKTLRQTKQALARRLVEKRLSPAACYGDVLAFIG